MKMNGSLFGLFSGIFWGLDTVILALVLSSTLFLGFGDSSSLISTFFHDGFSFLFLFLLILYGKKVKSFSKVLLSKSGLIIIAAALLGGPIGMGAYVLSINYLGATVSSSVSAIYPAVGGLLSFLFLKEKIKLRSVLGMFVAILSIILMGFSSVGNVPNLGLGMIFASICVLGWGSEAVIIGAALKEDIETEIALCIRQLTSMLAYGFIVMPFVGYTRLLSINYFNPIFGLIAIAGILGTISYIFYYSAIGLIGPSKAMGLNISYSAWAFIFQSIIIATLDIRMMLFVVAIILGSLMSAENIGDIFPFIKRLE